MGLLSEERMEKTMAKVREELQAKLLKEFKEAKKSGKKVDKRFSTISEDTEKSILAGTFLTNLQIQQGVKALAEDAAAHQEEAKQERAVLMATGDEILDEVARGREDMALLTEESRLQAERTKKGIDDVSADLATMKLDQENEFAAMHRAQDVQSQQLESLESTFKVGNEEQTEVLQDFMKNVMVNSIVKALQQSKDYTLSEGSSAVKSLNFDEDKENNKPPPISSHPPSSAELALLQKNEQLEKEKRQLQMQKDDEKREKDALVSELNRVKAEPADIMQRIPSETALPPAVAARTNAARDDQVKRIRQGAAMAAKKKKERDEANVAKGGGHSSRSSTRGSRPKTRSQT